MLLFKKLLSWNVLEKLDNFTPEEMMTSMMNKFKDKGVKKKVKDKSKDIMSYPSVVGIPINLVYEKIFSKK